MRNLFAVTACLFLLLGSRLEAATFVSSFTVEEADETFLGSSPSLVRAGDKIVARFSYRETAPTVFGNLAVFGNDPITGMAIQVVRNGQTVLDFVQTTVRFANGNLAEQSQIYLVNRDPQGRRDYYSIDVGGGDYDSGSVLRPSQSIPGFSFAYFDMFFYEKCVSGDPNLGTCVSNSPAFDLYSGGSPVPSSDVLFNSQRTGQKTGSLTLQFGQDDITFASYSGDLQNLSAVPEPQSWALLILGFGLIGAMLRARRPASRFSRATAA